MNDHTVPQLPPRSQCTGCAACAEGCPKNAIHMLPDREGFLYPTVTDACIQCGHCTHICPVLRQREAHPEPAVFAAWNPDNAVRQNSTCGGVFSLLADYVLEGGEEYFFTDEILPQFLTLTPAADGGCFVGKHGHFPLRGERPPFLLSSPGIESRTLSDHSILDIAPTLTELFHLPAFPMAGSSLLRL